MVLCGTFCRKQLCNNVREPKPDLLAITSWAPLKIRRVADDVFGNQVSRLPPARSSGYLRLPAAKNLHGPA
jgi:hypothetical protein